MTEKFEPRRHLTKFKGKDYLEVKWRMVWFREVYPHGSITTKPLEVTDERAVFQSTVTAIDETGNVCGLATGTKSETTRGFADYIEKAETGSIGRALAALGFGTQFAPDLEEGDRIVDSPVEKPKPTGPITDAEFKTLVENAGAVKSKWEEVIDLAGTDQIRWDLIIEKAPSDAWRARFAELRPKEAA